MSRKILVRWGLTIAMLLVVTMIWFAISAFPVSADCGAPPKSSCISCHASDSHVEEMGEWNLVHLSQDMCTNCHGGNGSTMDKGSAHQGMVVQPLSDTYTDCHSCHPADYLARSAQLAATLNVTPGCIATPTAFAISSGSGGSHTGSTNISSGGTGALSSWKSFLVIGGAVAGLAFFLLGLGWLDGHRVKV
jgi:hypothetical protein